MDSSPNRSSIRLLGYEYSRAVTYFVSICTKERKCLFGDIENQAMALNAAGRMLDKWHVELENKFKDIRYDEYIIMPNHYLSDLDRSFYHTYFLNSSLTRHEYYFDSRKSKMR